MSLIVPATAFTMLLPLYILESVPTIAVICSFCLAEYKPLIRSLLGMSIVILVGFGKGA